MPMTPAHGQSGAALPATLAVTALLGLMAAAFVQTARRDSLAARYDVRQIQLSHLADGAADRAMADLLSEASQFSRDGSIQTIMIGGREANLRIWDEKGKLDLNFVARETLANLLRALADKFVLDVDPEDLAARIVQYRAERQRSGAIAFRSVFELSRIDGVTEAVFDAASPYVTVASFSPRVNLNVADALVLKALPGASNADVEALLAARERGESAALPSAAAWVTTTEGPFYRIYAEVATERGARAARDLTVWITDERAPVVVEARPVF